MLQSIYLLSHVTFPSLSLSTSRSAPLASPSTRAVIVAVGTLQARRFGIGLDRPRARYLGAATAEPASSLWSHLAQRPQTPALYINSFTFPVQKLSTLLRATVSYVITLSAPPEHVRLPADICARITHHVSVTLQRQVGVHHGRQEALDTTILILLEQPGQS